ncbi:toll/interleukin-1 receptor domain-containing protein [Silanimonas sp.]|jgi:hypothetical protein|uniref:toll/interleukin-1 receptor domain-containing protein n=1 Tax=Silanimonas sp. TaxID=1929290 RepID=UPI0037CA3236
MSTVFLSYCRSDQADAARLATALAAAGLDVWWDHLIEGGAAFAKRIESALEGADAVVVLWSARSIESDWVLDESARGRDLRKLVPASLDGMPSPWTTASPCCPSTTSAATPRRPISPTGCPRKCAARSRATSRFA